MNSITLDHKKIAKDTLIEWLDNIHNASKVLKAKVINNACLEYADLCLANKMVGQANVSRSLIRQIAKGRDQTPTVL